LNSEHEIFRPIAERYQVDFYHRPQDLGSSQAKSDSVVADFMQAYPEADIVAWVNSTSPFQIGDEVAEVINYFVDEGLDSLITVENKQAHCLFNNQPLNYTIDGLFAQTQDLEPVQPFVYSIMMWRSKVFLQEFKEKGAALFCGRFGVFQARKLTGIIIKTQDDLMIADLLMQGMSLQGSGYRLEYDELVD